MAIKAREKNPFFVIAVFGVSLTFLFLNMSDLTNVIRWDANTCHIKSRKKMFRF